MRPEGLEIREMYQGHRALYDSLLEGLRGQRCPSPSLFSNTALKKMAAVKRPLSKERRKSARAAEQVSPERAALSVVWETSRNSASERGPALAEGSVLESVSHPST